MHYNLSTKNCDESKLEPENPESLSESARDPPDFIMRGLFAVLEWLSAFLLVLILFPVVLTVSLA